MAKGLLLFTAEDVRILRDIVRAYRSGLFRPSRPDRRGPGAPVRGRWAKIYSETGAGEYVCRLLELDAETETDPVQDVKAFEVNGLEGIAVDEVVWLERTWSADEEEWRFRVGVTGEVEGGTVPSGVIPAKNQGWIYKYNRAGIEEDAHADPRNETVYKPTHRRCGIVPAWDARGHVIGWWVIDGGGTWWESPWRFSDPGVPPF